MEKSLPPIHRRFIRVLACLFIMALFVGVATSQQPVPDQSLSNQDVLLMLKAGLSPEIIIAKIKSTDCKFDTSPTSLAELKKSGVPDAVILAMIDAPATKASRSAEPNAVLKVISVTPIETRDEEGDLSEIASANTVFLKSNSLDPDYNPDLMRNEILKDPKLVVVSREDQADFTITYISLDAGFGDTVSPDVKHTGILQVTTLGSPDAQNRRRVRIVWSARKREGSRDFRRDNHPSIKALREFLSALKKARKSK